MRPFLSIEEVLDLYAKLSEAQKIEVSAILVGSAASAAAPAAGEVPAGLGLLGSVELLRVLEPGEREMLARRLRPVSFGVGAFMVQEGGRDSCLYLLASGEADVRVTVEGSNVTKPVARLVTGDFFGEMSLLTGEPRRASVIASTPVECYRLDKADFDDLLRNRPGIIDGLAAILADRLVELRAVKEEKLAPFNLLAEEERNALLARMREASYAPGSTIVRQGTREEWMGVVVGGEAEVRVEQGDGQLSRQVSVLGAGDFFGEMSLLTGEPRTATIVARTRLDCYVLDKAALLAYLQEYPHLADWLEKLMAERRAQLQAVRSGTDAELRRQRVRAAEAGLARQIRRFFSLDLPATTAGKVLAEPSPRLASGRLLLEYRTPSGQDKPLHNVYVELWHRDVMEVFLGCATTARDGTFDIWYDPAGMGGTVDLELRVFEDRHAYTKQGELLHSHGLVFTLPGATRVAQDVFRFGELRVPYWEYDPDAPVPRALIVEQGDPPQSYSPGRAVHMSKVVAPLDAIKKMHLLEYRRTKRGPSLESIQEAYPENLTRRLERERPGYTRSDEYFGDRLLNGMSASNFDRDESDPRRLRIYHHWNSYEQDGVHALPNVDMRFEVRNEQLYPVQITLHMREPGVTQADAPTEKLTFTPGDGERWLQAKRIARVSAALAAELDNHLAATHFNTEQYAIATYRNLRRNPVRYLLVPHLKEVVLINHSSDSLLLGSDGYITRASALTDESIQERIRQVMGTLDWKHWRPMKPICATHTYARAANLFWDLLTEYVDEFFDRHAEGIAEHWYEVHMFSQELVERSAPGFLCRFLATAVADRPPARRGWFSPEERMDLTLPRFVVDGVPRALQPITQSNLPVPADVENMKQVCRYAIHHATFKHTWANARQYDDAGEIVYNCLGLRYGENGVFGPESDPSIAPPPDHASELLWISRMLSTAVYGYITRNEDDDIDPAFLDLLERRRTDFAALGFDIDTVQSRTNI